MTFAFGDHVLDVERRELRRSGDTVALEPQVFDLLVYLVRNRDRVVSKDELLENIWGGRIVSDSAVTTRLNAARKAIGDPAGIEWLVGETRRLKGVRGEVLLHGARRLPTDESAGDKSVNDRRGGGRR